MTGWLLLALIGFAAVGLLAILRMPRLLWTLVLSFLMLGAAGYAWQGRPGLRAAPALSDAVKMPPDPIYTGLRDDMFGRFGGESVYFGIADRQLADGDTELAAGVLEGAVNYAPNNAAFWTEFANAIALHDHAMVSPTALFAYRRAISLSPDHAGPPFFLGWAYLRAGQPDVARPLWARSLALAPPAADYRPKIADMLARLDVMLASMPKR